MSTNQTIPRYPEKPPEDFNLESCTIEDVDRAVFNLFNNQIKFYTTQHGETRKIPVIFATGERFAILRRNKPLTDEVGALIIPLISIHRTNIDQDVALGMGTNQGSLPNAQVIKKRLSKDDVAYQRLVNRYHFKNQDSVASENHKISGDGEGVLPGTVGTRRSQPQLTENIRSGRLLTPQLSNHIYEVITIPLPKYYTATYNVTIWSQYTQEMNTFLSTLMSSYNIRNDRSFKIESPKGYWFVARCDSSLTSGDNFDQFQDDERIIKYSFNVSVQAYNILPETDANSSLIKRTISSPEISFSTFQVSADIIDTPPGGVPSGNVNDYVLQDIESLKDGPEVSRMVGKTGYVNSDDVPFSTTIGGDVAGNYRIRTNKKFTDEITGKVTNKALKIKNRNQRQGETVYREQIIRKLDDIT